MPVIVAGILASRGVGLAIRLVAFAWEVRVVKPSLMFAVAGVLALSACNRPEPSTPVSAETPAAAPKPIEPPAVGVYVTNELSGNLSILDAATRAVVATVP